MTFRQWLHEMWLLHCEEFEGWHHRQPDYDLKNYFNRYRWWLRREYRHQKGQQHGS